MIESAARSLYEQIVCRILSEDAPIQCCEVWAQSRSDGTGLGFHWDKDESLFESAGTMKQPMLSSVLYTSDSDGRVDGPRLSPTVVTEQQYDTQASKPEPLEPQSSTLCFPRRNAYLLFDGSLSHGVLDGPARERTTVLFNFWQSHEPASLERLPTFAATTESSSAEDASPSEEPLQSIDVASSNEPIDVSELLQQWGLAVVGDSNNNDGRLVDAVHLEHPGLALVQVDAQQMPEAAADGLPLLLLPSSILH